MVKTSFILPASDSRLSSTVASYASIFGGSTPGNNGDNVQILLESDRVKAAIGMGALKKFPKVRSEVDKIKKKKRLNNESDLNIALYRVLKIDKNLNVSRSKIGLFSITYITTDKKLGLYVVENAYLESVRLFEFLQLSPDAEVIKVIDYPFVAPKPVSPQPILIFLVAVILSTAIGILWELQLRMSKANSSYKVDVAEQ